jgi:Cu(I)/Ag(I) efflux system membrane fusion protein
MKGVGMLPKADQAAAMVQRTCPVAKNLLGSHGKPIKLLIQGRVIFVCCSGCVFEMTANPRKYLQQRP